MIIKAYHQDFLKPGEDKNLPPELKLTSSPDSRVFEKMLETPYVPTVKEEVNTPNLTGVVETIGAEAAIEKATSTLIGVVEVALAPPGVLFIRDLLTPTFNLNACKKEDLDLLASLDLDIFPYHDDDNRETPILLVMHMFHQLKLIETFKIDEICLYRFLRTISSKYRQVPFHNWFHAFNVTQTMYHFLVECQAKNYLGPLEILALLVSTLCHDADHPGLNNSFQAKALTKIATLHKKSTLENHHLLHGYYALSFPECNILADLNAKDRDSFTRYMRDLILSTDLALHGIILRNMKERKKYIAKQNSGKNLSVELDYEDTIILMCCLIKCADLSNEIRPRNTAVKWAKMVMDEFIKQSKTEAKMDLAVTTFMDPSKIIIAKEQINFITNLCMPLYQNLQSVVPNLSIAIKQMNTNLADWQHRLSSWYTAEQAAQAANKSIWERNQIQDKKQKLSEFLGKQASS
uniref:PDEase domain-containing protein n=1 Tax=Arcella intermedia TaxID=1963864 RepID=A0A6B2L3H0_9EUKA